MSGQAKQSRVYRRWREQAARLVVTCGAVPDWPSDNAADTNWGTGGDIALAARLVLQGSAPFDVVRVRAHCEQLIARAHELTSQDHAAVFNDWIEASGGAVPPSASPLVPSGNGAGLARTAQRLLDTLSGRCPWAPSAEAQAAVCSTCDGLAWAYHHADDGVCSDCNATGHNLRGVLPKVEHAPVIHRKIHDSHEGVGFASHPEAWTYRQDYEGTLLAPQTVDGGYSVTRVVPRGQHRDGVPDSTLVASGDYRLSIPGMWPFNLARLVRRGVQVPYSLDQRIEWRGAREERTQWDRQPAWRRGEWLHTAQREVRAQPRQARGEALDRIVAQVGLTRYADETDASLRERATAIINEARNPTGPLAAWAEESSDIHLQPGETIRRVAPATAGS